VARKEIDAHIYACRHLRVRQSKYRAWVTLVKDVKKKDVSAYNDTGDE